MEKESFVVSFLTNGHPGTLEAFTNDQCVYEVAEMSSRWNVFDNINLSKSDTFFSAL